MTPEAIASICHEANRAYCEAIGDHSQLRWALAPDWQRESAINGVKFQIETGATPEQMHQNWMDEKAKAGWVYGPVKNPDARIHPCMVPYEQLPEEQRRKDALFQAVVRALA